MKCPNCGESQFPFSSPSKCKACAKLFSKCVYCAGLGSLGSRFAQRCSKCQGNGAVPELEPEDEEKLRAARLGAKYETSPAFIDCSICATPIPKLSIKQGMTSVQYDGYRCVTCADRLKRRAGNPMPICKRCARFSPPDEAGVGSVYCPSCGRYLGVLLI
jgi:hypothetical protein